MSAYIYGVICASLAVGAVEMLVPENTKTRPYLKLIFGLALLVVIVKPLGRLATELPNLEDKIFTEEFDVGKYDEIADEQLAESYKTGLEKAIAEEFGLSNFEVGVIIGEDRRPQRVVIALNGNDVLKNPYKIEEYVEENLKCECITVIG